MDTLKHKNDNNFLQLLGKETKVYLRKNLPIVISGLIIAAISSLVTYGITASTTVLGYNSRINANEQSVFNLGEQFKGFRSEYREDFVNLRRDIIDTIKITIGQ